MKPHAEADPYTSNLQRPVFRMPEDQDLRASLLRRGIDFMGARADYVEDPDCLEGMMMACIAQGITSRDGIVRTVPKYVGHSYAHVAAVLDEHTGPNPARHLWWIGEDKVYRLHPVIVGPPPRRRRPKSPAPVDLRDEVF